jgi:hypothetical protein
MTGCRENVSPEVLTISITSSKQSLPPDGQTTSEIIAMVRMDDSPCADSTMIQFVTSLGSIDAEAFTINGLARAVLISDTIPGIAKITGYVI